MILRLRMLARAMPRQKVMVTQETVHTSVQPSVPRNWFPVRASA